MTTPHLDPELHTIPPERFPTALEGAGAVAALTDPIEVRLGHAVKTVPRPARSFTTAQVNVPGNGATTGPTVVQALSEHQARRTVTLVNTGNATIYIAAHAETATPTAGFPITAGGAMTLYAVSPVWASCAGTSSSQLAYLAQYEDG